MEPSSHVLNKYRRREHKRTLDNYHYGWNTRLPEMAIEFQIVAWHREWRRTLQQRKRGTVRKDRLMQRQFTIELRVDYADPEKNTAMRTAIANAARHVYATAQLLADQTKPQIAIFSDDFFSGNQHIELLEDVIATGKTDLKNVAGDAIEEGGEISSELLDALKDNKA